MVFEKVFIYDDDHPSVVDLADGLGEIYSSNGTQFLLTDSIDITSDLSKGFQTYKTFIEGVSGKAVSPYIDAFHKNLEVDYLKLVETGTLKNGCLEFFCRKPVRFNGFSKIVEKSDDDSKAKKSVSMGSLRSIFGISFLESFSDIGLSEMQVYSLRLQDKIKTERNLLQEDISDSIKNMVPNLATLEEKLGLMDSSFEEKKLLVRQICNFVYRSSATFGLINTMGAFNRDLGLIDTLNFYKSKFAHAFVETYKKELNISCENKVAVSEFV